MLTLAHCAATEAARLSSKSILVSLSHRLKNRIILSKRAIVTQGLLPVIHIALLPVIHIALLFILPCCEYTIYCYWI